MDWFLYDNDLCHERVKDYLAFQKLLLKENVRNFQKLIIILIKYYIKQESFCLRILFLRFQLTSFLLFHVIFITRLSI